MRAATRVLATALLIALAGCGSDRAAVVSPTMSPRPGTLAVTVTSPFANDGAVSFDLTGPGIANVRPADGVQLFSTPTAAGVRVAALGAHVTGAVALFDVPDVGAVSAYHATVLEAADTDNQTRRDVSGYSMSVTPH